LLVPWWPSLQRDDPLGNGGRHRTTLRGLTALKCFRDSSTILKRHDVMYNDFVIVGPAAVPAGISGMKNADKARLATPTLPHERFHLLRVRSSKPRKDRRSSTG
jgi:hypothetical protein